MVRLKELECIKRLIEKDAYPEMRDFLVDKKLAKSEDFEGLTRDIEKARFICATLEQATEDEKLILLDYEWTLLPLETIKVTCVTKEAKIEFTHGL